MSAVRKILFGVAIVAFAGLGGYGAARALSTDGPDPHVDAPVVVRPANDSSPNPSGKDEGAGHPRDQRPGGDSHGADGGTDDSGHGSDDHGDDRGDDDRRDDHGGDDDDFEETHPTPDTFDDDDDDSGHGSYDDGDDD